MTDDMDQVTGAPFTESRVVCASFGKAPGHHEHKFNKGTVALCERYMVKLTNDMVGKPIAAVELPYRVQVRLISDWNDVDGS